jgi:hypothetical protein
MAKLFYTDFRPAILTKMGNTFNGYRNVKN